MRYPRNAFLAVTGVCWLALGHLPAAAQEIRSEPLPAELVHKPEEEPPLEKRLDVRVSVGLEHDDNFLHLRDDSIAEFESGDFAPDRFLINSVDDLIYIPQLSIGYSLTPETRRKTTFRFTATAYRFGDNSIMDYERYQLRFDRDFSDIRPELRELQLTTDDLKSTRFRTRRAFLRANRSHLSLRYAHAPERYVGQLTDDDGGGRRARLVVSNGWSALYRQRLDRGDEARWSLLLGLSRYDYDYNREFEERDSERDGYLIGINRFALAEDAYWKVGLTYEYAERRSNTALIGQQGPAGTIEDDLSYDGDAITLDLGRYWYRQKGERSLYKSSGVAFAFTWGVKDYLTDNVNDLSHYLREDDYWEAWLGLTHPFDNRWVLGIWAGYDTQETNLDPVPGFDRLEPSDFENFVFGVRISYYFSKKTQRSSSGS